MLQSAQLKSHRLCSSRRDSSHTRHRSRIWIRRWTSGLASFRLVLGFAGEATSAFALNSDGASFVAPSFALVLAAEGLNHMSSVLACLAVTGLARRERRFPVSAVRHQRSPGRSIHRQSVDTSGFPHLWPGRTTQTPPWAPLEPPPPSPSPNDFLAPNGSSHSQKLHFIFSEYPHKIKRVLLFI